MPRIAAVVVLIGLGTVAVASREEPSPEKKDNPIPQARSTNTIALTVSPAAAPVPALRYELFPRLRDRTSGNAAIEYHRAFLLRPSRPQELKEARLQDEIVSKWEGTPVEKLPAAEVKKYLVNYGGVFKALDTAARCNRCDWELTRKISAEGIGLLLPEIEATREISRFQRLRIKAGLAESDFDAAARDLQTGFRMAKDVGEGPTTIQLFVGLALASAYAGEVDGWVARPDAPNLYWALTTLPRPFIDPHPALEGESLFFDALFPAVKEFEKGPISVDRANLLLEESFSRLRRLPDSEPTHPEGPVLGKLGLVAYVALHYPEAKRQLIAIGRPAAEVEKMPPAQVVLLRAVALYRLLSDDQAKCFSLPYLQARAELARAKERRSKLVRDNPNDVLIRLFSLVVPAIDKIYEAHARVDRRFAGLRVVEAIRMHAAANDGRLPNQLADITVVPVPDDPHTGKPFEYKAEGNTVTLTAPPPANEQPNPSNSFQYVLTVRGK